MSFLQDFKDSEVKERETNVEEGPNLGFIELGPNLPFNTILGTILLVSRFSKHVSKLASQVF